MKPYDKKKCIDFVRNTRTFVWRDGLVFNAHTGAIGPSIDVLKQAVDEGFIVLTPGDQFAIVEKQCRVSFVVPESKVNEITEIVRRLLDGNRS
jgi:aspartate/methionine/tyrosine aminotransferase